MDQILIQKMLIIFFFSCANAKKWEIELTTLKSNNNRLTSALQESTANVDEWKRQLHTYKEENLRLKREMDAMKPIGAAGSGNNTGNDGNEEMRIEVIRLKSHILSLEKDMNELELKSSKSNIRDKSNEQSVSVAQCAIKQLIFMHEIQLFHLLLSLSV